jgi:hypothetical protein
MTKSKVRKTRCDFINDEYPDFEEFFYNIRKERAIKSHDSSGLFDFNQITTISGLKSNDSVQLKIYFDHYQSNTES